MHHTALRHLRAGTITAAEKRYLLYVCRPKFYRLIHLATVSG